MRRESVKRKMSTENAGGREPSPVYVFSIPGVVVVHLRQFVMLRICSCDRVGTPFFPVGWLHQWTLEFGNVTRTTATTMNGRAGEEALDVMEMTVYRAPVNQSQRHIDFWLKLKDQTVCLDFPGSPTHLWPDYNVDDMIGEVIDVTIHVPLQGEFSYLEKRRRTQFSGKYLKKFLSPRNKTDVTIKANDGQAAQAHREVLAARSPVLNDMLEIREGHELNLDMNFRVLEEFLAFIYTGQADFSSIEIGKALLKAGHVYSIEDLKSAADTFLCESLNDENAVDLFSASGSYRGTQLRKLAWALMLEPFSSSSPAPRRVRRDNDV